MNIRFETKVDEFFLRKILFLDFIKWSQILGNNDFDWFGFLQNGRQIDIEAEYIDYAAYYENSDHNVVYIQYCTRCIFCYSKL